MVSSDVKPVNKTIKTIKIKGVLRQLVGNVTKLFEKKSSFDCSKKKDTV